MVLAFSSAQTWAVCVPERWWGVTINSYYFEGKSHESVSSPRGPPAGLLAEGLTAASRTQEPEAAPYFEGLASSPCGSFNESPDSGTSEAPDDTSDSSLVVRWGREARARAGVSPRPALGSRPSLQTGLSLSHQGGEPRSSADLASILRCRWRGRDSAGPAKWG